jgi:hypothetical protein
MLLVHPGTGKEVWVTAHGTDAGRLGNRILRDAGEQPLFDFFDRPAMGGIDDRRVDTERDRLGAHGNAAERHGRYC